MSTERLSDDECGDIVRASIDPARVLSGRDGHAGGTPDVLLTTVERIVAARVADAVAEVERERDLLLQAMWDARTELGFDPDGNHGFHSTNYEFIASQHVAEAKEVSSELEDLIDDDEWEQLAQVAAVAEGERAQLAQKVQRVEALADAWDAMPPRGRFHPEARRQIRAALAGGDDS